MDPGLHVKQGVNHLNKVLQYAPMVAEGDVATVYLTFEDWNVVADTLFHMETPREFIPEQITEYKLDADKEHILLTTDALKITVEMM